MPEPKIVVISGSGISAESGLATFRDSGGLWEGYDVYEVASIDGWKRDPDKVQQFYNLRRQQAAAAEPNDAHRALAELEEYFEVSIITQNVDDLHERAGSGKVIHLHGELKKARSVDDDSVIVEVGDQPIQMGDLAPDGSQLRPHVVWFGEMVPMMEQAAEEVSKADVLIVVGTSLVVYPAASLINYTDGNIYKFIVDPAEPQLYDKTGWTHFQEKAGTGIIKVTEFLISELKNKNG